MVAELFRGELDRRAGQTILGAKLSHSINKVIHFKSEYLYHGVCFCEDVITAIYVHTIERDQATPFPIIKHHSDSLVASLAQDLLVRPLHEFIR